MSLSDIKSRILKLLKEDEEFRYAVAGLIGLSEILKEIREHDRRFNEILKVLKDHSARLEEHDRKFNRIEAKLLEHDKKFNEILARLEEHDKKFNSIMNEIREIRCYMDRMAISLEEEAREVIRYKLRSMGLDVELRQLMLPDLEVNLYGVKDDIFIIGEVVTRTGLAVVERVDKILERLIKNYPSYTRRKVLKVIYTLWITPESVEEARRRNIWVVKALEELTKPKIIEVSTR